MHSWFVPDTGGRNVFLLLLFGPSEQSLSCSASRNEKGSIIIGWALIPLKLKLLQQII